MATLYITSTAASGTGTLKNLLSNVANGDVIQPDPTLFPSGTPCVISPTSYSCRKLKTGFTIQGGQTRLVIQLNGEFYHGYSSNGGNYVYKRTFNDVDFIGTSGTACLSFTAIGENVSFYRCRLCGLNGGVKRTNVVGYMNFYDCAIYGNMGTTSIIQKDSMNSYYRVRLYNCTIGANFSYSGSELLAYPEGNADTVVNTVTSSTGWMTPPSTTFSAWTLNAFRTMNPRPSSSATWRTGAESTTSTIDIEGNPRQQNGALGAYEYADIPKLSPPTLLSLSPSSGDKRTTLVSTISAYVSSADYYEHQLSTSSSFATIDKSILTQSKTATFTGLQAGTTYYARARSLPTIFLDYDVSNYSSIVSGATFVSSTSPETSVTNVTDTSAVFTWNSPANSTSFKLTLTPSGGSSVSYQNVHSPFTANNLIPGKNYTFQLEATYSGAYPETQNVTGTFTTIGRLSVPTNLRTTNVTSTSAQVHWNSVENAVDYKVEYRRQGDTTWNE